MTLGYITLIGMCSGDVDTWQLGVQNGTPGYWESQMAVERAPAILSGPKIEDEGSESTSMRDQDQDSRDISPPANT